MLLNPWFWIVLLVAVPTHWLLPRRVRPGFLGAVSFGFLLHLAPFSTCAVVGWSLAVYLLAPHLVEGRRNRWTVGTAIILGLIGFLAYFKYVPPLVGALTGEGWGAGHLLIPLGISYYTFKLIHYAAEVARGNITDRSLGQFLAYMLLFPIFTAGPIERYDHFLANQQESWSASSMTEGLTRMTYGLVKKFALAEWAVQRFIAKLGITETTRGVTVATIFDKLPELPTETVWIYLALHWVYFYLDFSAYADIAIGTSRLFGLRIMENFNWPILATSMSDFWRRWHRTLSGWCQAYIYMPILGYLRRPTLALYASFLVIGLWHAGTPLRIMWGLWHGTGVWLFTKWARWRKKRGPLPLADTPAGKVVGWALTQAYVVASMSFLFSDTQDVYDTARLLVKLIGLDLPPP